MTTLANLTTYFAGESATLLSSIEKSRGGLKSLLASLDPVSAGTAKFNGQMKLLENAFQRGKIEANQYQSAIAALGARHQQFLTQQRGVTTGAGQMRAGMQQLSFQIGDVATQFASGTKPMIIFAQQGGQVIQALQMMTTKTTGLLGFLGGPWGSILTAALVVLTPFVAKLFEGGDAARDAASGTDEYTQALKRLQDQAGSFSFSSDEFSRVQSEYLTAEGRVAQLRRERDRAPQSGMNYVTPGAPGAVTAPRRSRAQVEAELRDAERDRDNKRAAIDALMIQRRNRETLDGGRRERRRRGPADRTDQIEERFDDQMVRLEDQRLTLLSQMTTDLRERARIEHEAIDRAVAAFAEDLKHQVAQKEITQERADELLKEREANALLEHKLINRRLDDSLSSEELEVARDGHDARMASLQYDLDNARTDKERRDIRTRMLDAETENLRWVIEQQLLSKNLTEADRRILEARRDRLDTERRKGVNTINRETMGPLGRFADQIPRTADEINEAFEKVATDGLQSLNDGLADAIMQSKSLGDVFRNVANQIIADLLRIAIQQALIKPLAESLGGGGGGFNLSSIFGGGGGGAKIAGLTNKIGSIPGFASGGSFLVGGLPGTDMNLLSINGIPRARVSATERVSVNPANDRGEPIRIIVESVAGEMFDTRVSAIAGGRAAQVVQAAGRAQSQVRRQTLR